MEFNQGWFFCFFVVNIPPLLFRKKSRQKTFELGEYVNVKVGFPAEGAEKKPTLLFEKK